MEQRFFICEHCGNIIAMVKDSGVPVVCCGEKMKEIIAEQLGVEEDEISLETSFKEDLGADSLDLFELTMALEEEYDIEIPAEELGEIETVNDVVEYLKSKGVEE